MSLTAAQVAQFERDGFLAYGRVLDEAQLRALSERIDAIAAGDVRISGGVRYERGVDASVNARDRVWQIVDGHLSDDIVRATCLHPNITGAARALLGPEIRLYSDQVLMKPAHHGSAVAWHQDYPYWNFDRPALVTCWLAIDRATIENGCMRVLPGSHHGGALATRDDLRLRDQEGVDEAQQVCVELPAGHCMFHHCLTLHATSANHSALRRRAIAITYMPVDLRWIGKPEQVREYLAVPQLASA